MSAFKTITPAELAAGKVFRRIRRCDGSFLDLELRFLDWKMQLDVVQAFSDDKSPQHNDLEFVLNLLLRLSDPPASELLVGCNVGDLVDLHSLALSMIFGTDPNAERAIALADRPEEPPSSKSSGNDSKPSKSARSAAATEKPEGGRSSG